MSQGLKYDVFLSHSSHDKPIVEKLAKWLSAIGIRPFLDRWHLVPGEPWQDALEIILDQSCACAVFIGPQGTGPFENEEMRAAIERRIAGRPDSFRVITVFLPGAEPGERGCLPAFLACNTWVEFRTSLDDTEAFCRLVAGIMGTPPGQGFRVHQRLAEAAFVATVSHDLRSPLTYIKSYASLIASSGPLNDEQGVYLQKIQSGIDRITALTDNLRDLAMIETGTDVAMRQCQLSTILRDLVVEMSTRAEAKDLQLTLDLPSDLPAITIDEALVRQATANLIDNAVKFTIKGCIHVSAYWTEKETVIKVEDSGIGIPTADQPRLFDRFYRVKTREAMGMRGNGLGLSIVKAVAELHEGRVWVESEYREGSTFFLALPLTG